MLLLAYPQNERAELKPGQFKTLRRVAEEKFAATLGISVHSLQNREAGAQARARARTCAGAGGR